MKGLDLCRQFFESVGRPMLKQQFAPYYDRIAAGLVGQGSDCYGFDDAISRDHDWGPRFCLWLTKEDFEAIGDRLQKAYTALPRMFMGYTYRLQPDSGQRDGVYSIPQFYERFTGICGVPKTTEVWLTLSDEYLYAATNGEVFHDPMGTFSDIRNGLLSFYPEDVKLYRIAARCLHAAQAGQYNFNRCVRRKAFFAAASAENRFCNEILSLTFLLNNQFAPYYKWKHQAVKKSGQLGQQVYQMIESLIAQKDHAKKEAIIEALSAQMITALKSRGLSDARSDFLLDHGRSVQNRITESRLRGRDPWGG